MFGGFGRTTVAAVAAGVAVAFGAGFITAKVLPAHHAGTEGGFDWPLFGKPRGVGAARPATPKPDGFAVWTTRVDTSRPDPLACVRMTRPLDPSKSYGDFVQVQPDLGHAPAISVHDDELCIAGTGFDSHRFTLLKGLPARTGETLPDNADVDFTFGDKPPSIAFAGEGVILPREESDGVGIQTVNVAKIAVEVWRVPDRNLVRQDINAPDATPDGQSSYDESGEDEGKVVWKGIVPVKGAVAQRSTTVFPLGSVLHDMAPGAYIIKAKDASGGRDVKLGKDSSVDTNSDHPASAKRWILFTDMALVAYQGSDGLDVVVRSLKTAKVLPGVRLQLTAKDGETLANANADKDGRVHFAKALLAGDGSQHAKMVFAYGPKVDFTALDLDRSPVDLSHQPVQGRTASGEVDAYLYADRGIYRPGEIAHVVAMVRDRLAKVVKDRKGALIIRRPSGVEYQKVRFDKVVDGVVAQDVILPKSAPHGKWRATLEMDGSDTPAGEVDFQVEDFAPQRLDVKLGGNPGAPLAPAEVRKVDVTARFLYGATGSGLQTQGEVRIRTDSDPFPALKDYQWGDQKSPYDEKFEDLGSTVTDGQGHATLSVDAAKAGDTTSPLVAAVTASVFEPGGRPVRESATLKIRTKPLYLGVRNTSSGSGDTPTQMFDIVAVNAGGARIAASNIGYSLIAENWTYDWYQKDGRWSWRRTARDKTIMAGQINIGTGAPTRLTRRLPWGDYRLELNDPATGAKTVIRMAPGWGDASSDAEAPDTVRISAGTDTHSQGDSISVRLQAPYAGEVQVAVATDRVIDFKTLSIGKDGGTVNLKTSAAWGGGAYVLVSVIQPRDPGVTPKPRRALGLIYIPLEPKGRKLTVALGAPPKLDSKAGVTIPIAVQGLGFGQRAHVTVAAVDEGILRITKQANPDPVKWYFGKRALTLDYRDDYGRLLDPNMGAPAALNYGADEIGGQGLSVVPIKTVALWSGVVITGADGKATIKLPAADFNGELRLMAVAWTDNAVGSGNSKITVRQPVVADLATPRFLAPGDKANATLELHNVEGKPGGYTAKINGAGGLLAPFEKLYQLALGQRIVERTPLNAPATAGIGQVNLSVTGPNFATSKSYPLQTRIGWGPVTRTVTDAQAPGATYTPPVDLLAGLSAGTVSMTVSYSPFKGFDPAPIADALDRYPYGCTEQLVSTAWPLLYAAELASDPKMKRITPRLSEAVSKLLDRQATDGSFGLWRPGDGEADGWLGAYAVDFLLSARAQGVPMPDEAVNRALAALRALSRPEGYVSSGYKLEYPAPYFANPDAAKAANARLRSRAAAYALYVMAKGGQGDLARLRWFHDVQFKDEASPLARAQVGAGLALMGDRARAHDSFVRAANALNASFKEPEDWYQSPLRDLGGVIALAYEAGETGIAHALEGRLNGAVKDPDRLNTQEEARLLQAAHAMLKASGPVKIDAAGVNRLNDGRFIVGKLQDARLTNRGTGVVWRTVTVRGVPQAAPAATASGMSVTKRFFAMGGGAINPATLKQGDRVIVLLSGASQQGRSMMAVVDDALPAGFEVETVLGPQDAAAPPPPQGQKAEAGGPFRFLGQLTATSVQEARDDRYVASLALPGNKSFAVAYVARATTPGDFFLPGVEARDMYHPAVAARSTATRAKIAAGQ
ncbi:MAG: alpha-2-macroglobulin family protein [Pseudomonadota bacterium]|nr:alpha-2-macroglobulin family protein [Pseudomonadota bacterium]